MISELKKRILHQEYGVGNCVLPEAGVPSDLQNYSRGTRKRPHARFCYGNEHMDFPPRKILAFRPGGG